MFGKKKDTGADVEAIVTAYVADRNAKAKIVIAEALNDLETKGDLAYTIGLIDMAYKLNIITMNERAAFSEEAHKKELKR